MNDRIKHFELILSHRRMARDVAKKEEELLALKNSIKLFEKQNPTVTNSCQLSKDEQIDLLSKKIRLYLRFNSRKMKIRVINIYEDVVSHLSRTGDTVPAEILLQYGYGEDYISYITKNPLSSICIKDRFASLLDIKSNPAADLRSKNIDFKSISSREDTLNLRNDIISVFRVIYEHGKFKSIKDASLKLELEYGIAYSAKVGDVIGFGPVRQKKVIEAITRYVQKNNIVL